MEDADGVGSPADAGGDRVGQPTGLVQHLGPGLQTDDALEVAHHQWERMWSGGGAETVVGVVGVGHPVTEGLVDGVLEGLRSRLHRHDRRTQQAHPGDVERLAGGVDRTHVDHALQTQQRARGRRRHPVLACTGLGDDSGLAHLLGQQCLPQHVVDLVRAGVIEILALEENSCATDVLAQSGGLIQRRGPSGVVRLQVVEFVKERLVGAGLLVGRGDLLDNSHQRLGHIAPAENPEVTARIRVVQCRFGDSRTGAGQVGR